MSLRFPKPTPKSQTPRLKPSSPILGYCTNVHSGLSLDEIKANLETHTLEVKRQASPDQPMGVGLWLPANAVLEFVPPHLDGELALDKIKAFREWLDERGLYAYTLNGFPVTDMHVPIVKHLVYYPDWASPARLNYTMALAAILHHLLPEGAEGSISTLPIGWAESVDEGWADNLCDMIEFLDELEQDTGRCIHLDIEPEPGYQIEDTVSMILYLAVMEMHSGIDLHVLRRHLRVCLDVCHSAVMFEGPTHMLEALRESGWSVGKVQISSGLRAPFKGKNAAQKREMRSYLERFAEDRYLHQTTIGTASSGKIKEFHEDLPEALAAHSLGGSEWRVHYHVPVHLEQVGPLSTTQSHIVDLLNAITPEDGINHFEVETYAWGVLPEELQERRLADGIAKEMRWAGDLLNGHV